MYRDPTTNREVIERVLTSEWQSAAAIAAQAGIAQHRATELLRDLWRREKAERRSLPSLRALTYEYRLPATKRASGVVAGPPYRRGWKWTGHTGVV